MTTLLKTIFAYGPLIFGIGFLAPLIAQIIERGGLGSPFGLPTIVVGLALGGLMGLVAQLRGRWI